MRSTPRSSARVRSARNGFEEGRGLNRLAALIAIGFVGLALVSAGIFAAATVRFIDHSQTQLLLSPGSLHNGTFTRTPAGWSISLVWRFVNPGRLPITVAMLQVQFVVDNRSNATAWNDVDKIASEYTGPLSFNLGRNAGVVVGPGATTDQEWGFAVTNATEAAKIAPDPSDGKFYVGILGGGRIEYYVSDVNEFYLHGVPSSYGAV